MGLKGKVNILAIAVSLLLCGIMVGVGLTHNLRNASFQTAAVQFPSRSLAHMKSTDLIDQIKEVTGVQDDTMYLFDNNPMVTLDGDGKIKTLQVAVLIPEGKNKSTRYMAYQMRVEETGTLHVSKLYEVPEPADRIPIQVFWDSLCHMPLEHVLNEVKPRADQYMLTLLEDNFVIQHQDIERSGIASGNIRFYTPNEVTNVHLSEVVISWIMLPMYVPSGQSSGFRGISGDSFVFYYSES